MKGRRVRGPYRTQGRAVVWPGGRIVCETEVAAADTSVDLNNAWADGYRAAGAASSGAGGCAHDGMVLLTKAAHDDLCAKATTTAEWFRAWCLVNEKGRPCREWMEDSDNYCEVCVAAVLWEKEHPTQQPGGAGDVAGVLRWLTGVGNQRRDCGHIHFVAYCHICAAHQGVLEAVERYKREHPERTHPTPGPAQAGADETCRCVLRYDCPEHGHDWSDDKPVQAGRDSGMNHGMNDEQCMRAECDDAPHVHEPVQAGERETKRPARGESR